MDVLSFIAIACGLVWGARRAWLAARASKRAAEVARRAAFGERPAGTFNGEDDAYRHVDIDGETKTIGLAVREGWSVDCLGMDSGLGFVVDPGGLPSWRRRRAFLVAALTGGALQLPATCLRATAVRVGPAPSISPAPPTHAPAQTQRRPAAVAEEWGRTIINGPGCDLPTGGQARLVRVGGVDQGVMHAWRLESIAFAPAPDDLVLRGIRTVDANGKITEVWGASVYRDLPKFDMISTVLNERLKGVDVPVGGMLELSLSSELGGNARPICMAIKPLGSRFQFPA